ncbi:MAG TPA: serine/threonine-protein kinase [Abditibacteriaceae bacterium]|jgi:serine/threonine-protein kinase
MSSSLATQLLSPPSCELPNGADLQAGHFRIKETLARGGYGIVYLATDTHAKRSVVIKEFYPPGCRRSGLSVQLSSSSSVTEYEDAKKGFVQEIHLLSRFRFPHIVTLYASFEENNTIYCVMEYLSGETLAKKVDAKGAIQEQEVLTLGLQIGKALDAMHRADVLHLDVTGSNIMLTEDGQAVLIDFGSAREIVTTKSLNTRTLVGTHLQNPPGTPGFASMKQYAPHDTLSPSDDIYQFGATLYYLLTGKIPIESTARDKGSHLKPPHSLNRKVSRAFSEVVMQALHMDESQRPASMAIFIRLLESVQGSGSSVSVQNPIGQPATAATPALFPGAQVFSSLAQVAHGYLAQINLQQATSFATAFWPFILGAVGMTSLLLFLLLQSVNQSQPQVETIPTNSAPSHPVTIVKSPAEDQETSGASAPNLIIRSPASAVRTPSEEHRVTRSPHKNLKLRTSTPNPVKEPSINRKNRIVASLSNPQIYNGGQRAKGRRRIPSAHSSDALQRKKRARQVHISEPDITQVRTRAIVPEPQTERRNRIYVRRTEPRREQPRRRVSISRGFEPDRPPPVETGNFEGFEPDRPPVE